jgi:proteasome lid subunit RPN8/RPN11
MSVYLASEHLSAIRAHGERTFPEECGGLLLGVVEGGTRVIRDVVPLENIRRDARHQRVELDPRAYARAERDAEKRGWGVWGYYHSHPDHPAVPSGFDLEHAPFTAWSYVIVAVAQGQATDVRAWTLSADRTRFDAERIVTAGAPQNPEAEA